MNRRFPSSPFDNDPFFGRGRSPFMMGDVFQDFQRMARSIESNDFTGGVQGMDGTSSMSFSSYSYSSSRSGNGGQPVTVMNSISETRGPGGLVERTEKFADSRQGTAGKSVSRRIGDRGHTVATIKESDGTEKRIDTLHNLDEHGVDSFEGDWNRMRSGNGRYIDFEGDRAPTSGTRSSRHQTIDQDYEHAQMQTQDNTLQTSPRVQLLEDDTPHPSSGSRSDRRQSTGGRLSGRLYDV